ncbi:hypothetical protein J2R96_008374 [Bradyrhizobium elkanii]|nr:hypothetical protein [Bradyrhizobium elkanii]
MKALSNSAAGAEQLSSPKLIPDSHATAGQGVKNVGEPSGASQIPSAGTGMNRRSIMNMFVGGAALAGASVVGEPVAAEPAKWKVDIDGARPELRDSIRALERAYNALKEASDAHNAAFLAWRAWEEKHPYPFQDGRPGRRKAAKKYDQMARKFADSLGFDALSETHARARSLYRTAQLDLAKVRTTNFEELALKSAASVTFEGGLLEDGHNPVYRESQIIAWSVGYDILSIVTSAGRPPEDWCADPESAARATLRRWPQKRPGALAREGKLTEAGLLTRYQSYLVQELETVSWVLYRERDYAKGYVIFDSAVQAQCRSADGSDPFFDEASLPDRARGVLGSLGIDTVTPDV